MKKYFVTWTLILVLATLAGLTGYNYFNKPFLKEFLVKQAQESELQAEQEKLDKEASIDPVDRAILDMSLEEKIYQLIAFPVTLKNDKVSFPFGSDNHLSWIKKKNPGYVTIFGSELTRETVVKFTSKLQDSSFKKAVPLIVVDHEGGTVQRLSGEGFSNLPAWSDVCELELEDRNRQLASSALELSDVGINIVLAPVLDVNIGNSFLKSRACDKEVAVLATARSYIEIFSRQGIMPVVKHFPGLGSVTKDIHFTGASVEATKQDLRPFESLLNVYPNIGVMTTHVAVDGVTNGVPCSLSNTCLQSFPEKFPGVILFTDALEMESAVGSEIFDKVIMSPESNLDGKMGSDASRLARVVHKALLAGNHVLVFGQEVTEEEVQEIVDYLVKMAKDDVRFYGLIEEVVRKTLELKV